MQALLRAVAEKLCKGDRADKVAAPGSGDCKHRPGPALPSCQLLNRSFEVPGLNYLNSFPESGGKGRSHRLPREVARLFQIANEHMAVAREREERLKGRIKEAGSHLVGAV